jgi:peptidoglycan/LPS O-acetylase OafA/YrhL
VAKPRADLLTAQALRGFAALLVVAFHSVYSCVSHVLGSPADAEWDDTRRHLLHDQWAAPAPLRITVAATE